MLRLRTILVLCAILAVCYCDNHNGYKKKKKHHHHGHHDLFFKGGLLWYFTFLAIKIKTVLVLGTVFTIGIIAGKAYALIKFAEHMKEKQEPNDHHDEKIVFYKPHSDHHDSSYHSIDPSTGPYSGHSHDFDSSGSSHNHDYQSYPSYYINTPPFDTSNGNGSPTETPNSNMPYHEKPGNGGLQQNTQGGYSGQQQWNRRSQSSIMDSFYTKFDEFAKIIIKLNITEIIFKNMGIKSKDCKRMFICKAEYTAKQSILLKTAFHALSDDIYLKYKPNTTVEKIDDCENLYRGCVDNNDSS